MQRVSWFPAVVRTGLGCLVMVLAAGCGGQKRLVLHGSVSLKGQPLPAGIVQLQGPGDRLTTAPIQPDGTFVLTDVLPGEVKVAVTPPFGGGGGIPPAPPGAHLWPGAPQGGAAATPQNVPIPARYQDVNTSGLTYTITPGTKELEIKLE